MAEKGCGMINGNSRVIWPQYTSKTSVSIRGKVDPEFLYGVGTEEDEAHIRVHHQDSLPSACLPRRQANG